MRPMAIDVTKLPHIPRDTGVLPGMLMDEAVPIVKVSYRCGGNSAMVVLMLSINAMVVLMLRHGNALGARTERCNDIHSLPQDATKLSSAI